MEKLLRILDQHGIVYKKVENEIHAYVYSYSNDYDVLTVENDNIMINGKSGNMMEWLGY